MDLLPVNSSEAFALQVCERSFLSMWCYNNPLHKKGKELCDILVVCDPHTIIISVKECLLNAKKDAIVAHTRWKKKAIENSIKQVFTAERWLKSKTYVTRKDGSRGIDLPDAHSRKVHRIAVAFGSRGEVPISSHKSDKGYVHVMTDSSFSDVLTELDTITDFVNYLVAKENKKCAIIVADGNESEILAWYLMHDRTFPKDVDCLFLDGTIWAGLRDREDYKRKKEADRISYGWDALIESMNNPNLFTLGNRPVHVNEAEAALRVMAKESRFSRRVLSEMVSEFWDRALQQGAGSRIMFSDEGVIYVLTHFAHDKANTEKFAILEKLCFLARHVAGKGQVVLGIGFTPYGTGDGFTNVLSYVEIGEWTQEHSRQAAELQAKLNIFKAPLQKVDAYEYPRQ